MAQNYVHSSFYQVRQKVHLNFPRTEDISKRGDPTNPPTQPDMVIFPVSGYSGVILNIKKYSEGVLAGGDTVIIFKTTTTD